MALDYEPASGLGHGIAHTGDVWTIALGVAGVVIAVAITIATAGTDAPLVVAASLLTTSGTLGTAGKDLGSLVDHNLDKVDCACEIATGLGTLRLGPKMLPAAHVASGVKKEHSSFLTQGSSSVFIGPMLRPMSRRGDKSHCGGAIVGAVESILVGGARIGEDDPEQDSDIVHAETLILDIVAVVGGPLDLYNAFTDPDTIATLGKSAGLWKFLKALGIADKTGQLVYDATGTDNKAFALVVAVLATVPTSDPYEGGKGLKQGADAAGEVDSLYTLVNTGNASDPKPGDPNAPTGPTKDPSEVSSTGQK
jgi:hypothetical protein